MSLEEQLRLLRWRENEAVVNPFGDFVWLKVCEDEQGIRIGITDCCLVSEPCGIHDARRKT